MSAAEKYECRCGQPLHGKVEMLAGRLHSILGCEILGPVDVGTVAEAVTDSIEALEKVEWDFARPGWQCMACGQEQTAGHAPDCAVAKALTGLRAAVAVFHPEDR